MLNQTVIALSPPNDVVLQWRWISWQVQQGPALLTDAEFTHVTVLLQQTVWVWAIKRWESPCRSELKILHAYECVPRMCTSKWLHVTLYIHPDLYVSHKLTTNYRQRGQSKKQKKKKKEERGWQRKKYNFHYVISGSSANEIPPLSTSEGPAHGSALRLQRVRGSWLPTSPSFPCPEGRCKERATVYYSTLLADIYIHIKPVHHK